MVELNGKIKLHNRQFLQQHLGSSPILLVTSTMAATPDKLLP